MDLSGQAQAVVAELRPHAPAREVKIEIEERMRADGDSRLLRAMQENLPGNAWKFTGKKGGAHVAFRRIRSEGRRTTFEISDNPDDVELTGAL